MDSEEDSGEIGDFEETCEERKILQQVFVTDRIFPNFISLSEFVQVVCTRAEQIQRGGRIYTTAISPHAHEIAIQEIIEKVCPLSIYRKRGEDASAEYIEVWAVNELDITQKCISKTETILDKNKTINIVDRLNRLFEEKK